MVANYRNIGTGEAEIRGIAKLERFGQVVQLDSKFAAELIVGHGSAAGWGGALCLLSDEDFKDVGFTEKEIAAFAYPGAQSGPDAADFLEKRQTAFEKLHDARLSLEANQHG